ncbi:DUF29 family protein [Synechococcales cyanobacterium C]|uniref:DUF29 family protein n=1 Tax=Petrachloros mirabilis ULC683 TaxID=2781853 RepID=A0A8K2A951_9CYAN|nr:DUF29 domain-containing protein [Petrachloros mirabilis]NCJ07610.1 DUF29 family protein [Petrachloros mirabilis ULC683]
MQTQPHVNTLYDADFYAWTQQQAEYLRSGKLDQLDIFNLVEEIETLGRQERRELENRLGVLLGHLLKWYYQPQQRSSSWFYTIRNQRRQVLKHLKENPSLEAHLSNAIAEGYQDALNLFGSETGLNPQELPQPCPFSTEQILQEAIEFPEPPSQRTTRNHQPKL